LKVDPANLARVEESEGVDKPGHAVLNLLGRFVGVAE